MVGHRRHDADQPVVEEDGPDDEDVGQVHPAGERVVDHDDVARIERAVEFAQHRRDRVGERPELVGQGHALGDDLALRVAQGGREVHRALDRLRVRGPDHADCHLLADRGETLADQLAPDRVGAARPGVCAHPASSMTMFQSASRRAVKSGGTTVVAS